MVNTHWGGVVEDNSFGTHEFLDLCRQLACEPYICGNVGSGTVREMQQWVEYLTAPAGPMADLRRAHGRPEPWKVTFWGVGNENWGCGGRMRPDYYADLYRRHACYLRNFGDNKLFRIACGPSGGDTAWTEVLMREAARHMDGLSVHYYSRFAPPQRQTATAFDEAGWIGILKLALRDRGDPHRATRRSWTSYDPARRVAMIFDEWGAWWEVEPGTNPRFLYQQNTLRDAMVAAVSLDIFARHCDRLRMANLAQTVNVLQAVVLTEGEQDAPDAHVPRLRHVPGAPGRRAAARCTCGARRTRWARTPSPPSAPPPAATASGKVHLSLSNLDPHKPAEVACVIRGRKVSTVAGTVLTADDMQAHNTFDAPDTVRPRRVRRGQALR